MADYGNVETKLNAVTDDGLERILKDVFQYVLKDVRFGRVIDGDSSKNFGGGFFTATTPSVANTEFSIRHTFGRKPYLVMPLLPLDQVGAKVVRLEVTRAADANRIYLRSPDTDAAIFIYVEG